MSELGILKDQTKLPVQANERIFLSLSEYFEFFRKYGRLVNIICEIYDDEDIGKLQGKIYRAMKYITRNPDKFSGFVSENSAENPGIFTSGEIIKIKELLQDILPAPENKL